MRVWQVVDTFKDYTQKGFSYEVHSLWGFIWLYNITLGFLFSGGICGDTMDLHHTDGFDFKHSRF